MEPVPPEHTTALVGVMFTVIPGTTVTFIVAVLAPGHPDGLPDTWYVITVGVGAVGVTMVDVQLFRQLK
jgi:hypothetical protein